MSNTKTGSATQGVAPKADTKTTVSPVVEKSTSTVTANGIETPKTKVLTVEDRKGRTEVFSKLLEKHDNLKDVQQRVESFAIGSDEHSQTLTLKDSKGNNFNTGNPALLKDVIALVRAQVTAQVGVVEDEILHFII